jgi:hypothetical protein
VSLKFFVFLFTGAAIMAAFIIVFIWWLDPE